MNQGKNKVTATSISRFTDLVELEKELFELSQEAGRLLKGIKKVCETGTPAVRECILHCSELAFQINELEKGLKSNVGPELFDDFKKLALSCRSSGLQNNDNNVGRN